jgi:thiol-disulfide isomerase/thioredoxin
MFGTAGRPCRAVFAAVLFAALMLLVAACGGSESAAGNDASSSSGGTGQTVSIMPVSKRPAAPPVSGPVLSGGRISLADLRGKVVVLNTWGSWCAPCRAEAPALESVYRQTKAKGVAFLGINVRDNDAAARAFQRTFHVTYPSIPDSDGRITASFRELPPNAIPTTLILDRQGRIAARIIGGTTVDMLQPAVLALAAEPR